MVVFDSASKKHKIVRCSYVDRHLCEYLISASQMQKHVSANLNRKRD